MAVAGHPTSHTSGVRRIRGRADRTLRTRVGRLPYSEAAREDLEWQGVDFVEYDVEKNAEARERMLDLTGSTRTSFRS